MKNLRFPCRSVQPRRPPENLNHGKTRTTRESGLNHRDHRDHREHRVEAASCRFASQPSQPLSLCSAVFASLRQLFSPSAFQLFSLGTHSFFYASFLPSISNNRATSFFCFFIFFRCNPVRGTSRAASTRDSAAGGGDRGRPKTLLPLVLAEGAKGEWHRAWNGNPGRR